MNRLDPSIPFPLFRLFPSTGTIQRESNRGQELDGMRPGTILLLHAERPSRDWDLLRAWIPTIRREFPSVAIILRVPQECDIEMHHLAQRAAKLHVRGLLRADEPVLDTLRPIMTQPDDLAGDVAEWFGSVIPRLSPALLHLIREIFTHAGTREGVSAILKRGPASETGTRARLRKKGLPSPHQWLQVARAIHSALRIQAGLDRSLAALALDLGYKDQSALSHQCRRTLGIRPAEIRGTLGWEWLLHDWVRRSLSESPDWK